MSKINQSIKKRVLITGAATGIGKATAIELAQSGYDIMINYFPSPEQEKEAHELAHEICAEIESHGCQSLLFATDISQEKNVLDMFDFVKKHWGGIDILINNAGIQRKSPSHQVSIESFHEVMGTNAIGPFLCAREALKIFLDQNLKGIVINNTSVHQIIPKPQYLSYSMSKGALGNLTKTLALEYADRGIRFNNVAPGAISTPINPWRNDERKILEIDKHIPLKKVGRADQVAKVIRFLVSQEASYMTGQTVYVDGGLTLYADFGDDWASS